MDERYFQVKKKDKQKKSEPRRLSQSISQPVKDSAKKEVNTVFNDPEGCNEVGAEQKVIESEQEVSLSYKEHVIFAGIGIVFSIILYLVSFLV